MLLKELIFFLSFTWTLFLAETKRHNLHFKNVSPLQKCSHSGQAMGTSVPQRIWNQAWAFGERICKKILQERYVGYIRIYLLKFSICIIIITKYFPFIFTVLHRYGHLLGLWSKEVRGVDRYGSLIEILVRLFFFIFRCIDRLSNTIYSLFFPWNKIVRCRSAATQSATLDAATSSQIDFHHIHEWV